MTKNHAQFGSEQEENKAADVSEQGSIERLYDDEAVRRQFAESSMGCRTFWFVKRCMRDPALRARIQARAAEIRANGEYGLGST